MQTGGTNLPLGATFLPQQVGGDSFYIVLDQVSGSKAKRAGLEPMQVCVAGSWSRVKGYGAGCTLNSRLHVRWWSETLAHVFTRNLCLHQYTPEPG